MDLAGTEQEQGITLLGAVRALGAETDERTLLRRTTELVVELFDAQIAVIATFGMSGRISDFVVHVSPWFPEGGTGDGATGGPQRIREGFEVLCAVTTPARLDGLQEYRDVLDADVESRLAMPVMLLGLEVEGEQLGRLHVAGPVGRPFTAEQQRAGEVLLESLAVRLEQSRERARVQRRLHFLEATANISEVLAPPVRIEEGLAHVAQAAARIVDASAVAVLQEDASSGRPDIVAVAGESAREVPDVLFRIPPAVLAAAAETDVVFVPDGRERLVVLVPLNAHLSFSGVLLCLLEGDHNGLRYDEAEALGTFADQTALALDRAQAVADRHELLLVTDRDRIARDLHDLVIQRLFATGLRLQGTRRYITDEDVGERLESAVADLDVTISDIRGTIFNLQRATVSTIRDEIRGVVKEYIPLLGFTPVVRTSGPVDTVIDGEVQDHVRAVLREALSNIMRHAGARSTVVELAATSEWVRLRITDDGRGLPPELSRQSGLRNIRTRADELGGLVDLRPASPAGTVLEWSAPLAR